MKLRLDHLTISKMWFLTGLSFFFVGSTIHVFLSTKNKHTNVYVWHNPNGEFQTHVFILWSRETYFSETNSKVIAFLTKFRLEKVIKVILGQKAEKLEKLPKSFSKDKLHINRDHPKVQDYKEGRGHHSITWKMRQLGWNFDW